VIKKFKIKKDWAGLESLGTFLFKVCKVFLQFVKYFTVFGKSTRNSACVGELISLKFGQVGKNLMFLIKILSFD